MVVIDAIKDGSPFEGSGLEAGNIILAVNGHAMHSQSFDVIKEIFRQRDFLDITCVTLVAQADQS